MRLASSRLVKSVRTIDEDDRRVWIYQNAMPHGGLEWLDRAVMLMCEASHWRWWPDQMGDRPMWVVRRFLQYRGERMKESNKINKDSTFPAYPDWLL